LVIDLYIKRSNEELESYRKKTHTFRYISNTSKHCWTHKIAACRLVNVLMNKNYFNKEKQHIIEIAKFNGFEENTNLKLIKKQDWKRNIRNYSNLVPDIPKINK